MKAKFELKENVQSVFKKKRNVAFGSLKQINDELDRHAQKKKKKKGGVSKVDYNDWASPMVCIYIYIYIYIYI